LDDLTSALAKIGLFYVLIRMEVELFHALKHTAQPPGELGIYACMESIPDFKVV